MSRLIKRIGFLAFAGLSVVSLQGCIAAAVVGGAAAATKVATDPRSTGRQIDDETLEEKAAYNLNKDAQLQQEGRVNVVAYNGKLLLIGQVPNESAKQTATNVAGGIEGVSQVYNEIRVGSKVGVAQIGQDSWITSQIKSKLLWNSQVKSTDVKVITENGEVFLMGSLTQSQADAAADVARNVAGVNKVIKVIEYLN